MRSVRPVYPFLLAIYPALALAAQNVYERIHPAEMALPLGASLYLALLVWAAARPVTTTSGQRALVSAAGVILFFGYGALLRALRSAIPAVEELLSVWVLIGELVLLAGIVLIVRRKRWRLEGTTRYLNAVCWILVLFALFQVVRPRGLRSEIAVQDVVPRRAREATADSLWPDVVVVILDSYNSNRALNQYYGFDNDRFGYELRGRGFAVTTNARGNYAHTFQALASMLNARYLDHELAQVNQESDDKSLLDPLLESHLVWRTLREQGYRFVFFPTFYALTSDNRNADIKLPAASETSSEFTLVWLRMTPVIPLSRSLCRMARCSVALFDLSPEPAHRIDWKLQQVPWVVGGSVPSFVFLHLMVPHEPFIYDSACRPQEVYWPRAHAAVESTLVKAAYIAQLECVNRKMLELVDQVLRRTHGNVIIMLQADHGYGQLGRGPDSYGVPSPAQVDERTSVFGAYYLPGVATRLIYDSISPINVFRGVLREYFNVPMPPVEDRAYFSTYDKPYKLERVR